MTAVRVSIKEKSELECDVVVVWVKRVAFAVVENIFCTFQNSYAFVRQNCEFASSLQYYAIDGVLGGYLNLRSIGLKYIYH